MHVDAPRALDGMRLELFSMLAVAASQGLGVALMPPMLIEQEIARGDLIVACPQPLRGNRAYYLVTPELAAEAQPSPALRVFSQWLQHKAQEAAGRKPERHP
jgi:DNA-binding transcriptional LysR family regulator